MGAPARTLEHAREAYAVEDCVDEAFEASGAPRPPYEELLERLGHIDLTQLEVAVAAEVRALGIDWGSGSLRAPFRVDPVPRIVTAGEWGLIERGVEQRVRALALFASDVYADRRIVAAGVVPAHAIESADYFEPWMVGIDQPPWAYMPVAGVDLVRDADGRLLVLEDNVRTPSGLSFATAARKAVDGHLPGPPPPGRRSLASAYEALGAALRLAAKDEAALIVLLSDGPANSAWYEHRALARRLGITLVTPGELYARSGRLYAYVDGDSREVRVVYRRTDEDRLRDEHGKATWIADLLLDPCRDGRVTVVNGFGSGVADDKLLHSYADEMIRFYLDEEPILPSVPTYDLNDPEAREQALTRVDQLVLKPRAGHGGHGILIGPHATLEQRVRMVHRIEARPEDWVAQETVQLSRLPTVAGGTLEPRHIDLRAFVLTAGQDVIVPPGGLTRYGRDRTTLVVNSSQGGGGKDTWVLS